MTDSDTDPYPWFTRACHAHFDFLAKECGCAFSLRRHGAECRAEYVREGLRVLVDYSPGFLPDMIVTAANGGLAGREWNVRDLLHAIGERPPYEQAPANHGLHKQIEAGDVEALKAYIREHFGTLHREMDEAVERRAQWLRRFIAPDPDYSLRRNRLHTKTPSF